MISPPRMAAVLLAATIALPASCLMAHKKEDRVSTENIRNAFADLGDVEVHDIFAMPKKGVEFFDLGMVTPQKKFDPPPPRLTPDRPDPAPEDRPPSNLEARVERDVCEESGGWKVGHGRTWHCAYPHGRHHYYHHRRRH